MTKLSSARRAAGRASTLAGPIRTLIVAAIVMALAFVFGGRLGGGEFRRVMADLSAPLSAAASWPAARFREGVEAIASFWNAAERVRELEARIEEIDALRAEQSRLTRLVRRYESLLSMTSDPNISRIGARAIGETDGPFVRTLLIDIGESDGVREGQAVTDARGLLGRIVTAGRSASRVLLVTDFNSRVPIELAETGARGILAGDNTDRPEIRYLAPKDGARMGQQVLTSGAGGLFPPGLPVGRLVDDSGIVRVLLNAEPAIVSHVHVLRYAFPEIDGGDRESAARESAP